MKARNKLLTILLLFACVASNSQTPTGEPAGTVLTESPSDSRAIGLTGGKTFTFTNVDWPEWFSTCYAFGFDQTLPDVIDGYNTEPPNGNCPYMDDLEYNAALSNLTGGVLVFSGTTFYRYLYISGAGYTGSYRDVRCTITFTNSGSATPLPIEMVNSRLLIKATGDFDMNVIITALSPTDAKYISGGGGVWTPAITLFNNLHTDPLSSICTSFNPYNFFLFTVNATASNNGPYCVDESIDLYANGGTNYSWEGPDTYTSLDRNPVIDGALTSMSGNYLVTVVNSSVWGCMDTASTNVLVAVDTTAPVPDLIDLDTITGVCSAIVASAPTATDNCADLIIGTTTDSLEYTEQGTYTITWTYDDNNGYIITQEQVVIVNDTIAPVPDSTSLEVLTDECSVTITTVPTASDNCVDSIAGTTTDPLEYNVEGTHTVTWTFDDGNGNVSTQEQTVIISDIDAPVPDEVSLADLTDECSVTVTTAPTATDNCIGTIDGTTSNPLEYTHSGTYTITWIFDDGNGNISTQDQTVIIEDIIAPVPDVTTLPDLSDECSLTLSLPTASDNCAGTINGTTTDLIFVEQGTFTITWTYDDGNGNTTDQTQNVTLEDVTAPMIGCVDNKVKFVNLGETVYTVQGTEFDLKSTEENCDLESLVNDHTETSTLADATFSIGTHTITFTAMDDAGNTGTCSFELTVNEYVSVETLQAEEIEIYPNPATGFVQIRSLEDQSKVSVYNITGKVVLAKQLHGDENNLDISALANGLYILQVQTNSKIHTLKIIKE